MLHGWHCDCMCNGGAVAGFRCESGGHKSSACRNLLPFISAGMLAKGAYYAVLMCFYVMVVC